MSVNGFICVTHKASNIKHYPYRYVGRHSQLYVQYIFFGQHNFQKPSQVATYFQIGPLFVNLTWLVTGISEGKKRFFPSQKYVEPCDLMGAFLCTIGSYYFHPLLLYIAAQLKYYISWLMHQFDTLCIYTSIAIGVVILCIFKQQP